MELRNTQKPVKNVQKKGSSGFSTSCESPIDIKLKKLSKPLRDFDTRKYSLPLAKILFSVPTKKLIHEFGEIKKQIPLKQPQNVRFSENLNGKKKKICFLNHSFDIEKAQRVEKRVKNKPSRFLPIAELSFVNSKPMSQMDPKGFEQDLKLFMQNKYDKVKADFQIEKILSLRAQTRHQAILRKRNRIGNGKLQIPVQRM